MPALAPLKLTFYNPETGDEREEYLCNFVQLRYLKLAVQIAKSDININMDTLNGLIVDLFGRQFSVEELKEYTIPAQRIILLQAIVRRPSFLMEKEEEAEEETLTEAEVRDLEEDIGEMEISMIQAFRWSQHQIDRTDIESLFLLVKRFAKINDHHVYIDQIGL